MSVAIVSVYPPQSEQHTKMSGVASMSKNIADSISSDTTVHVLANKTNSGSDRYIKEGVTVHRCWKRGILYPLQIIRTLSHIDKVNTVHVHHEYDGIYGGILMNVLFPLLLLGLQLSGVKTVVQPHGVVFDSDIVNTQTGGSTIVKFPDVLLEAILWCFNQLLVSLSDTIIIPNPVLEQRILDHCFIDKNKLFVIPHGVESKMMDVRNQRSSDDLTLLYFGYITWRKGPDILASVAESLPEEWEIILAGGKVPHLSEDPSYQAYYNEIRELAAQSGNITITGFVDEKNIDIYFKQADVLVLPYRTFVAASGVFCLGLRYSLPFLLSEEVSPLLQNDDITSLMAKHNVNKSTLTFSIEDANDDLERKVRELCCDPERYKTASKLSQDICEQRRWGDLQKSYSKIYE